ncbi:hypothetical protein RSAG8_01128, partial [Rhizoctonia solani AG-8 WAC10335]
MLTWGCVSEEPRSREPLICAFRGGEFEQSTQGKWVYANHFAHERIEWLIVFARRWSAHMPAMRLLVKSQYLSRRRQPNRLNQRAPLLEHSPRISRSTWQCNPPLSDILSITMHPTTTSVVADACFAVTCQTCGKTTWQGCGRHIDSVMANVKPEDQCTCPR